MMYKTSLDRRSRHGRHELGDSGAQCQASFDAAEVVEQRQVASERTRRFALPVGLGPSQEICMFLGRRTTPRAPESEAIATNLRAHVEPDQCCGARQCRFDQPAVNAFDDPVRLHGKDGHQLFGLPLVALHTDPVQPVDTVEIRAFAADAAFKLLRQRALARAAIANDYNPRTKRHGPLY